jgi:RNA polymerase sigma-70 factor (ECF subfamily)
MTTAPDTDELLDLAASGDDQAAGDLLDRHRGRLGRMIAVRMDPRMAARVDPSDVVQEALIVASQRLPAYLVERPIPFYPWLRQLAWERLVHLHDRHVAAKKRSVAREAQWDLSNDSVAQLAAQFAGDNTSPSGHAVRREMQTRVRAALDELAENDREILVLWYLERLNIREIAAVLDLSEPGVKSRHRRALVRISKLLHDP